MEKNKEFERFVRKSFSRHGSGDWGDLCEEDKAYNDYALEHGERLFSAYNYMIYKRYIKISQQVSQIA